LANENENILATEALEKQSLFYYHISKIHMIKKAVIAAAGRGTRMLHLSKHKPKQLIKVGGLPFLKYLLDNLFEAGYHDLILVTGHQEQKMREFVRNYEHKIKLIDQFTVLGKEEYGTVCALKSAREAVNEDDFLMVYGDNLFSVNDLKSFNIEDDNTYLAGFYHQKPERYGVLMVEDGNLVEIVEKPRKHIGNLINAGLYKFTPEIFEKANQVQISQKGEYELTDAINMLAKEKKVKVKEINDFWLDFSNPADIIKASKFIENGNFKDFA
jgi:bifunctional UDP-N-acetylglucosamine pyrophosphorylase/glucosamine-1-phosphate N-acetyltransferase